MKKDEKNELVGDSILKKFGFDVAKGLPVAKDEEWPVDVFSRDLMDTFFGAKPSTEGPATRNYFRYYGSVTAPSCVERVHWISFTEPLLVKTEEIAVFKQNFWDNNKPIQATNDRVVLFNDMHNPEKTNAKLAGVNDYNGKKWIPLSSPDPAAPAAHPITVQVSSSAAAIKVGVLSLFVAGVVAVLGANM